jgi:hypothetical protein
MIEQGWLLHFARSWITAVKLGILGIVSGLIALGPIDAKGQLVRGLLLDAGTEEPVVTGIVTLVNESDEGVVSATADERGVFLLRAPSGGEFRLRGERIGYASAVSSVITVPSAGFVEVVFRLSVEPAQLDPITILAPSGWRITPGAIVNAERRDRGLGVFLDRADVLARSTYDIRDAVRGVEGIRVGMGRRGTCNLGRSRGSAIALWDGLCLISSMGWGCMNMVINEQPLMSWGGQTAWELAALLPRPEGVAAMEIYRTYQEVPDRHKATAWPAGQLEPCGLVAVWTIEAW